MHEVVKEIKDDEVDYYLRVSPAVAMHEVVKELKDDEVDYYLRVSPAVAMHEVIKELKDDEVDHYLRVSPAVAMHEVVKELKDDEVEAVARHVPDGHGGHAPVQPGNAVLFDDLLHTLARSVVVASRCCRSHTTERWDGHSCPHNHTSKELSFSSSFSRP